MNIIDTIRDRLPARKRVELPDVAQKRIAEATARREASRGGRDARQEPAPQQDDGLATVLAEFAQCDGCVQIDAIRGYGYVRKGDRYLIVDHDRYQVVVKPGKGV